jgi:curli biogenesis system outer membrane secretion channel CsgG
LLGFANAMVFGFSLKLPSKENTMNRLSAVVLCALTLSSCAVTSKVFHPEAQAQALRPETQIVANVPEQGLKRKVAIGRFSNETQNARGAFYDAARDPLGKQALDILATRLASTGKFILLERADMDKIQEEMKFAGTEDAFQKVGADYLLIGAITEFGRTTTGEEGVFSRSKTQTVQAGISIRLVDVTTGQIVYSEEAKGQAETTASTTLGVGGSANYDATLSDKAISAAISKLVENIVNKCTDRPWRAYFLSHDADGTIISGGKSQGVRVDDVFAVFKRGKQVKNKQTGMMMELPGKEAGMVKVLSTGGDDPQNEYAVVQFVQGAIQGDVDDYYIQEVSK